MKSILFGTIIFLILQFLLSSHAPIVTARRRQGERGSGEEKEPEKIDRCIEILRLKPGASQEEVTQAYKDLVNVWHPDRFANNQRLQKRAEQKLKEINAAYDYIRSFYRWK